MATGKEEREAFVSGLTGTSIWEVYGVILTSYCGLILRNNGLLCSKNIAKFHKDSIIFAVLWDFVTIVLTSLLCFTVLADHISMVFVSIMFIVFVQSLRFNSTKPAIFFSELLKCPYPKRSPAVSNARVWTNLFTAIAILAVDFHIFPRRFAKTETYGVSVMDVGIGSFIIANGAVGPETRRSYPQLFSFKLYMKSFIQCLKSLGPCLILGLVRLLTVKAADYQQHVSEYGVHWNFFFTLATVKILTVMVDPLIPDILHSRYMMLSVLIGVLYQILLSYCGLSHYIINGPDGDNSRDTFISANREGIFSCIGYMALYYMGVHMGKLCYQRRTVGSMMRINLLLFMCVPLCIILIMILEGSVESMSRRLANVPYCLFSVSFAIITLNCMFLCDVIVIYLTKQQPVSMTPVSSQYLEETASSKDSSTLSQPAHLCIMACIDYNQLLFFLLANLYTGIVNVLVDTINTGPVYSLLILMVYLLLLVISIVILKLYSLKIL